MIVDDVYEYLGRYIVYPNNHARVIHTLWIFHNHLIDAFDYTPRLCVLSAEKRSGKSTVVKLTKVLSQKGEVFVNPTPASIYSIIEERQKETPPSVPTLCIDEQDRLWNRKETGEIIAILDQGFERDNEGVPRVFTDNKGNRTVYRFKTFCPVVLAGIETNQIPETIIDRSVVIRMKRRQVDNPVEAIKRYRTKDKKQALELKERIEQWAQENLERCKECVPEIPEDIDDRYADICEPLIIVAKVADVTNVPTWETRIYNAIKSYASNRGEEEPSSGIMWLRDIRDIIISMDRIFKHTLIDRLNIHRNHFNTLRRKFDIPKDHTIRILEETDKGWYTYEWEDVFSRYLETPPSQDVTMVTLDTMDTEQVDLSEKDTNMSTHEDNQRVLRNIREYFHMGENEAVTYERYQEYVNKIAA